uniref:Uncharacterized protein n=1 Tax=Oryza rufipogon TaxID=4529 RepID=A0A0E0R9L2_ORYRU
MPPSSSPTVPQARSAAYPAAAPSALSVWFAYADLLSLGPALLAEPWAMASCLLELTLRWSAAESSLFLLVNGICDELSPCKLNGMVIVRRALLPGWVLVHLRSMPIKRCSCSIGQILFPLEQLQCAPKIDFNVKKPNYAHCGKRTVVRGKGNWGLRFFSWVPPKIDFNAVGVESNVYSTSVNRTYLTNTTNALSTIESIDRSSCSSGPLVQLLYVLSI